MINELSKKHNTKLLCKVLRVPRSTYYAAISREPSKNSVENEQLKQKIMEIYTKSGQRYGCIKIRHELKKQGYHVSQNRVLRLMRKLGIKSIICKKYRKHSKNADNADRKNLVNRDFHAEKINQIWCSDITYIKTAQNGWTYLACVLDLCSRRLVAYSYGKHMTADLVVDAVSKAFCNRNYPKNVIIHSDQGSQYTSDDYLNLSKTLGFTRSYSAKGCPYDNAPMESFNSILKREEVYLSSYHDFDSANLMLFDFIEGFYNRSRIHGSIGFLSPVDFEKNVPNS